MFRVWPDATGTNAPLLACGQTVTNGAGGVSFLAGPDTGLHVEAVSNGVATLTYAFAGDGEAWGLACSAALKMTAWEMEIREVTVGTNGMPVAVGGKPVQGDRIPQGGSLSTYVPFGGGGAPVTESTSPRWVTFTVVTNAVTNSATLSMTRDDVEGFKVWELGFGGATTNGTFAWLWQGASNAFLRAECPTNAAGAMMPLGLTYLDAGFDGQTNAVTESFSLYRQEETNGLWGSTCSIAGPRADIGLPAFSSRNAFVVRLPPEAAGSLGGNPACEVSVGGGDPAEVPLTREEDGSYVSCLVVPVSELDGEAGLGLEGYCDAVKIALGDNPYATGWQAVKIDIKSLANGNARNIVSSSYYLYQGAMFSALVSADDPANERANKGVVQAGETARIRLDIGVTALLSPDRQMINDLLPRHRVWVHSGHGSYANGLQILEQVAGGYRKADFTAVGISRDDLEYHLVFMNTCESTDQEYRPIMMGKKIMGFYDEPPVPRNPHAVLDIGARLNAISYVGWDCSVDRNVSVFVPSMLMEELDTQVVDGEYVSRAPSDAVNAVKQKLYDSGGMDRVFSSTLRCIPKEGVYERVIDMNKVPN